MTRWEDFKTERAKAKGAEECLAVMVLAGFLAQLIFFTLTGGF